MLRRTMMAGGVSATYLDQLATLPVSVLSLRKLYSTATNCIRIRRSSDNAEQDIGFSSNSIDTGAISSFVGANSAFVVTWYDQSGNSLHATQATAANQPRIVNAGTYLGEVEFDGSNDSLKITNLTMGTAYAGLYTKIKKANTLSGTEIMFELSDNFNSYATTAFVVLTGFQAGMANTIVWNTTTALASLTRLALLFDRTQTTASDEVVFYKAGVLQTRSGSSHLNTTGTLTTRDFYIGGRGGTTFMSDQSVETLVLYNADTSGLRSSIESIVA